MTHRVQIQLALPLDNIEKQKENNTESFMILIEEKNALVLE